MSFVRSFFSGVESTQHFTMALDAGVQHMLMSYLYILKQPGNILAERKRKYPHLKFMIDSGAHTLQMNMAKPPYNAWTMQDLENYVSGYAAWLDKNRKHIYAAVELDVAYSVNCIAKKAEHDPYGDTVVSRWREQYFRPLQRSGMNIVYVWHPSQGYQGWEELCANFPYVGLPGEMSNNSDFNTFMTVAKRYLTKVHGFAATKHSDYKDWPWFSIDSITWKAGEIYGTLPIWNEKKQHYKLWDADQREQFRHIFEEQGLDANLVISGKGQNAQGVQAYMEVTRSALISMARMEAFYKERFKHRVQYYELRLPVPGKVFTLSPQRARWLYFKAFSAEKNFPDHSKTRKPDDILEYLHALSCVEYKEPGSLRPKGNEFLARYFPTHMPTLHLDPTGLLKEMAVTCAPANEAAQRRTSIDDYADSNNPPRRRDENECLASLADTDELPPEGFDLSLARV